MATAPDFRRDGQEFFKYFDKIQDEIDDDMVRRLRDGLDGLLIYAGLFSAVNSAFLVYTLPDLKPNPVDDTNALLSQLIQLTILGDQSDIDFSIPSRDFSAKSDDLFVNRLFSLSLALSLLTSFFVVWGKQWLANYQAKSGVGAEQQRWHQLNRFLGAERWRLLPALEMFLPLTLLSSLAIFAWGLALHVGSVDELCSLIILGLMLGGYCLVGLASAGCYFDRFCPYQTPLIRSVLCVVLLGLDLIFTSIYCLMVNLVVLAREICIQLGIWIRGWSAGSMPSQRAHKDQHSREHFTNQQDTDLEQGADNRTDLQAPSSNSGIGASDGVASRSARPPVSYTLSPLGAFAERAARALQYSEQPEVLNALPSHAIVRVLDVSEDQTTIYHAAANLCSIEQLESIQIIFRDEFSLERLQFLLGDALLTLAQSKKQETPNNKTREVDVRRVVLATAFFHIIFSVGSSEKLLGMFGNKSNEDTSYQASTPGEKHSKLKNTLARIWHLQDDRLGRQPPVFTSVSLAAGLLLGCLDPSVSIFYDDSRALTYRLDAISSADPSLWNQLALLALACNTRGGLRMNKQIPEYFRQIQKAYIIKRSTGELAEAVHQAIRSHVGEKTRLPCEVFKLAWKLFVHGRQGGDAARAFGDRVPFLGILEAKVRDDEQPASYRSYFRDLRSECFELMLDTVRTIPSGDRVEASASWRFQAKFVLRAVGHYAMCIIALGDVRHVENDEALTFIRCVRALVPPGPSKDAAPSNPAGGQSDLEKEYRSELKTFEDICQRFEVFIRSGQRRLAPEDQWCFTQN